MIPETVIIGAGPAGTGALVWAAGEGLLAAWLDAGVTLIEARPSMGGTVGQYQVNADTLGGIFLEALDKPNADKLLVGLRDDPLTTELRAWTHSRPPLDLVGRFLARLGDSLAAEIARHPRSQVWFATKASRLQIQHDGSVSVEAADDLGRQATIRARSAVVAVGGRQRSAWDRVELLPGLVLQRWSQKIITSDDLLREHATDRVAGLCRGRHAPLAVVLGGSHSAFSAAWALLARTAAIPFGDAGIRILHRRPPRVFYPTRAEAIADAYGFSEADVCQATGRVNRLAGLRGDGRDLWRRMNGRSDLAFEPRAVACAMCDMRAHDVSALLDAADVIVVALGYRFAALPVYGADRRRIALAQTGPSVAADARLLTSDGCSLPNVFAIGLGTGFHPTGGLAGEASFDGQQNSLWLYQNGLGKLIYDGVRSIACGQPRPCSSGDAGIARGPKAQPAGRHAALDEL